MSPSPLSSPTAARHYKNRDRRVSFDVGTTNASKAAGLFSHLAAVTSAAAAAPAKPRHHNQHRSHHSHSHGHGLSQKHGSSYPDRRTRVEDAVDDDDENRGRGDTDSKAKARAAAAKSLGVSYPGLPTTTASAAAGGFETGGGIGSVGFPGVNPAFGTNPIFTHMNGAGIPQQPYTIQAYPSFLPAMPQGLSFAAGAPNAVNGVDPTAISGVSFLPTVPDATNGPMVHTYVPRNDVPGQGGVIYMQQPSSLQPGYATAAGVPLANIPIAATTAPMVPLVSQQPAGMAQPIFVQQQQQPAVAYAMGGGGIGGGGPPVIMMPGMGVPGVPGGNYSVGAGSGFGGVGGGGIIHPEPALGVGQTPGEVLQEQLEFAYANNMYEPQDFKPADDDKSRFYWVREVDGNWTQRSRATIDHIGCRWYITDGGVFYAVRLPD